MQDTERAQLERMMSIVDDALERIETEVMPVGIAPSEALLASVLNMVAMCCPQHRAQVVDQVRAWLASIEDSEQELH